MAIALGLEKNDEPYTLRRLCQMFGNQDVVSLIHLCRMLRRKSYMVQTKMCEIQLFNSTPCVDDLICFRIIERNIIDYYMNYNKNLYVN